MLPFTGPARLIVAKITFLCQFYGSSFSNIQILWDTCNNLKITPVQRIKSLSRSQNLVPESQHILRLKVHNNNTQVWLQNSGSGPCFLFISLRAAIKGNLWGKKRDFVWGHGSLASPTFCQQLSRQNPNFFHRSHLEHHTGSYQSKEELTLFLFVCLEFQPPCLPPGASCLNKHTNTRQDKHKEFKSEIKDVFTRHTKNCTPKQFHVQYKTTPTKKNIKE